MLRKLCKLALLALAAGPVTALAQVQPAGTLGTNVPTASPEVNIWAATARYVYQDDPKLKQIQPALLSTIKANSIKAFSLSIVDAVALEKKQLSGQKDLLKFQELFKTIRTQLPTPNDPAALAKAIVTKLDDNAERMADPARAQRLTLLTQQLTQLATGTTPALPATTATPALAADNPMDQVGAAPAAATAPSAAASLGPVVAPPANQWLWLSLALSALSLASVAVLWNMLSSTRRDLKRITSNWENSSSKSAGGKGFSPADLAKAVQQEVSRQLAPPPANKPARPAPTVAAPLPPKPSAPTEPPVTQEAPAPPPAPRLRTQYVGEAPFNNSFPARALSDQPGAYSMFAIESSEEQPEQGTFAVTGNLASHVRDHRSVLEPVCEYVGGYPLGSETRVITEQPGVVHRRGGDWQVTQRAKVRFE